MFFDYTGPDGSYSFRYSHPAPAIYKVKVAAKGSAPFTVESISS